MRIWAAMMIGTVAAPAVAADQFDLICTGGKAPTRYRVDLARGEACEDACDRVWKMGLSTSGELRLIDKPAEYRGAFEELAVVSRTSGAYRYRAFVNGKPYRQDGVCETAPFSGFPTPKF